MNENMDPNDRLVLETYDKWMKFQKEYGIVKMQRVKQMITDSADPVSRGLSSCWEGGGIIFSHNGIICKKTLDIGDNGCVDLEKKERIWSIICLKDKYRPIINLARDSIEQFDLETASALAILDKIVPGNLFSIYEYFTPEEKYLYMSIPQKKYRELLADYPQWEEMLRFDVKNGGQITAEELRRTVEEKGFSVLDSPPLYSMWRLYGELCFTYLKNNYTLYLNRREYKSLINNREFFTIVSKEEEDVREDEMLPPSFSFKISRDELGYDALKKCIKIDRFCNKEHRLIKFLMKNSKILADQVPGLWNKMLRVLTQADGNKLVQEVNLILDDLRKITDLEIHVPDGLFLSKDDLVKDDSFIDL